MKKKTVKKQLVTIRPQDPVYIIGVVSKLLGMPEWTLRTLEKEGLVRPKRLNKKNRVYSMTDIRRLEYIHYLMDEKGNSFYLNSFPSQTIDPTGSGDAYSSGFVYAVIAGKTTQEAMALGAANAAYVVESVGAEPGLIKHGELEEKIKKFEQFVPEIYNG